ncbi:SpoIIE family protein phosphatase [Baekduia sp. Peel2402]|uniref:SpoIIE family protein phosphatase n=1 Tax=Baekduia sp. Peel2402 TaxID=3458296 RepID=UPI00403EAE34
MEASRATDGRLHALLLGHRELLALVAEGAPLRETLARLVILIEAQSQPGVRASVLLLDEDGDRLRHGAAPNLPKDYNDAVDGLSIGPVAGSCGTAAYRREPVVASDLATDPLWADYQDLARAAGAGACWSHPIVGARGALLGTFAVYHPQPAEPTPEDEALLDTFQQAAAMAIERERDRVALRRESRRADALERVGNAIASRLDLNEIVQIATDAATDLTHANFGAFFYNVIEAEGESYMLYTLAGVPREAFERFPMPRNTAIFAPTFEGVGTVRLHDVLADPRYGLSAPYHGMPEGHLPVRSYLAVPVITSDGDVAGGLFFGHREPGMFDAEAEGLVEGIAAQAAVAIENARLYGAAQRDIAARDRALAERDRVARVLQESLLPSALPQIPGVDLGARYRACSDDIGGDFYDVFALADGRWGIVVGDVCGKGAEAAALTALARHTVRTAAMLDPRPAEVLRVLNEALLERDPSGTRFCTAVFGVLETGPDGARATLAAAGHPPPLIRTADGAVQTIDAHGPLLGVLADVAFADVTVALDAGATLVLHTDGLTDVGHASEVLNADWVRATLAAHGDASAAETADRLADGAVALQSSAAGRDDIAVLAIAVAEAT